jgi:hypothetical protein
MNYISKSLKNDRRPILAKRQSNQVRVTIGNKSKDILIQERSWEIAYAHGGNLTIDETSTGQTSFTLILSIVEIYGISTKNHSC